MNFWMVPDSSPRCPSSTTLLRLCPSDATFPREHTCCSCVWRTPGKACSDLSLPPSLTHMSQGQEGRGSTRPVFSYQFRRGPGAFPQGRAWPSTEKCLHSKAGACHHPSTPFEAGQKACQQAPSLRAPLLALGGAVSCLRFAASHEREWQAQ